MPQQRIPFAGLSQSLMPMILQIAGERRKEQKRLQGESQITQAITTWYDPEVPREEKIGALAKLITGNAPVTGAMMQSLQAEQDLDPFFEKLGIGKDDPARVLWNMGALSRQQLGADLLRTFKGRQQEKDFDKSLQILFDAGLVKLDGIERSIGADGKIRTQVEQIKAIADYREIYGEKAAEVVMQQAGMMGIDTQWQGALAQIDEGVALEEMSAADRATIIEKVKTPANRAALFGQKGDAAKMFSAGIKSINEKARAYFPIFGLGEALNKWATGQPSPFLNATSIAFLEKNFEKTGEHKFDAVVEEGYKAFRAIEDLQTRINISAEDWTRVEAILKVLQAIPESQIDWLAVEREIANTGAKPADMQRWYQEILNASR